MLFNGIALAAAFFGANAATVQSANSGQTIIVEGQRLPSRKEALRTVTDMTMIVESQIARFHDPVCPLVVGMQREAAAIVEQRIRQTARQLGARVENRRCEANLLLFVAGDGAKLVEDIRIKRPSWFASVPNSEKQRILDDRPVRAWSVSSVRNEDGQKASGRGNSSGKKSMVGTGAGDFLSRVPQVEVWTSSFLQNASRYHLDGSVIIIDADAVEGLTLRQLADYAVMRGVAKIRPPENVGALNSILSIFASRDSAPKELTPFDRRYLAQLYRNKGFESSVYERQRLARAVSGQK